MFTPNINSGNSSVVGINQVKTYLRILHGYHEGFVINLKIWLLLILLSMQGHHSESINCNFSTIASKHFWKLWLLYITYIILVIGHNSDTWTKSRLYLLWICENFKIFIFVLECLKSCVPVFNKLFVMFMVMWLLLQIFFCKYKVMLI